MPELRSYQRAAVNALWKYWREGQGKAPLVVAPTGSGKSHIIAEVCAMVQKKNPKANIMMLTHRAVLIEQNRQKLFERNPQLSVGIWSASIGQKQMSNITFAQVQSMANVPNLPYCALAIIDEAHLVPPEGEGQYQTVLSRLRVANPDLRICGMTATPYRLKQGLLTEGKNAMFDGVAYEIPVDTLISLRHLVRPITKEAENPIDLAEVRKNAGEYVLEAQEAAVNEVLEDAIEEIVAYGIGRKKWLVFCATVASVEQVAERLRNMGIAAASVIGESTKEERAEAIASFKEGATQCLVSCDVLTTGFDAPCADMVVLLRATASPGLYVQLVGRGLRTSGDKVDCLVLDYGGNVLRHGPIDYVQPPGKKGKGTGDPPFRVCQSCKSHIPARALVCSECGAEQEIAGGLNDKASSAPVLGGDGVWVDVDDVDYERWRKPGKPDSIRVSYWSGSERYCEWICPEHGGFAQAKWEARKEALMAHGRDVGEILQECWDYPAVKRIKVAREGKYWRVLRIEYNEDMVESDRNKDTPKTGDLEVDFF